MNFIVIDDITIKTVSAHETFCDKLYVVSTKQGSKFSGIIGEFNLRTMIDIVRKFCLPFTSELLKHKGVWSHEFLDWIGDNPLNPIEQLKQMNGEN